MSRSWTLVLAFLVVTCLASLLALGQFGGGAAVSPRDHLAVLAFAADGSLLAGAGLDKIPVWEMKHNKLVRTITTGGPRVLDIAFAPQDEFLAAGCDDGKIRVWNAETGELLKVLAVDRSDRCGCVDFSPDGRLLAGIYSRQTGESDAGGVQEELRLWDLARDEVARTLTDGENAKFVSSDFSPDGRTLAVGLVRRKDANQTTSIRLWSIAENRWDPTFADLDGTLFWLAFSPDGKTLAVSGIRSLAGRVPIEVSQLGVWNSATGKSIWCSETVHFEAKEPAFSSDGARVATRGSGPSGADIVMRDATNGRIVAVLRDALAERVVFAYSPVGSLLATSDGLHVELRDSETSLVRAVLYPFPAKP